MLFGPNTRGTCTVAAIKFPMLQNLVFAKAFGGVDVEVSEDIVWRLCPGMLHGEGVKKKDGTNHMVIDYCKLNSITKKDSYPFP